MQQPSSLRLHSWRENWAHTCSVPGSSRMWRNTAATNGSSSGLKTVGGRSSRAAWPRAASTCAIAGQAGEEQRSLVGVRWKVHAGHTPQMASRFADCHTTQRHHAHLLSQGVVLGQPRQQLHHSVQRGPRVGPSQLLPLPRLGSCSRGGNLRRAAAALGFGRQGRQVRGGPGRAPAAEGVGAGDVREN